MSETTERSIWFYVAIGIAVLVAAVVIGFVTGLIAFPNFQVSELQAYADGSVYVTIRNTGTIGISRVTVDGVEASPQGVSIPLPPGHTAQFVATGFTLNAGEYRRFEISVTFTNGAVITKKVAVTVSP